MYGVNGLVEQMYTGLQGFCVNGSNTAESLDTFLYLGRELTAHYNSPVAVGHLLSLLVNLSILRSGSKESNHSNSSSTYPFQANLGTASPRNPV